MKELGPLAVDAKQFIDTHAPWHPIASTALSLRDGGLIVSLRCTVCSQVFIEATPPKRRRRK